MSQIRFADAEYAGRRKKNHREVFLEEMEQVEPWKALPKLIEPHYSVTAGRDRRPCPPAWFHPRPPPKPLPGTNS